MNIARTLSIVVALTSASLASADSPAEKKPAREEVSAADGEKFLAFMTKIFTAVTSNADNCPKMGTQLNALLDANADIIKMANDAKAAGKKLPQAVEDKLKAKGKEVEPSIMKCKDDKSVEAAFARMSSKRKVDTTPPPAKK